MTDHNFRWLRNCYEYATVSDVVTNPIFWLGMILGAMVMTLWFVLLISTWRKK